MFRVLTIAAVLCLLSAFDSYASPFTPDAVGWTVLDVRVCCVEGAAVTFADRPLSYTNGYAGFGGTLILPPGTTSLTFDIDLEVTMQERIWPEQIAEYPFPSVAYGTIHGSINKPLEPGFIIETCCLGDIAGVYFNDATAPQLWSDTLSTILLTGDAHVFEAAYRPLIVSAPEPTTLITLATGLLALSLCRRRTHLVSPAPRTETRLPSTSCAVGSFQS